MWHDEWYTLYPAGMLDILHLDVWQIPIFLVVEPEIRHPPLYFMLIHLWMDIFGQTEFAGRLFSLYTGLLAVAWLYRLGWTLSRSFWVAFGAVVAMGLSSIYVHHLHELRMYPLMILLTIITIWGYWRMMTTPQIRQGALWFIGGFVGLFMTYLPAVFLAVILGLYHLVFAWWVFPKRQVRWRWTLGAMMVVALIISIWYVPWFVNSLQGARAYFVTSQAIDSLSVIRETILLMGNEAPYIFLFLFLTGLLLVRTRGYWFATFLAISIYGVSLITSQTITEAYNVRNFMIVWPFIGLMIGYSLNAQGVIPLSRPILIGVLVVAGVRVTWDMDYLKLFGNPPFDEFSTVERTLMECVVPSEDVVIVDRGAIEQNVYLPNAFIFYFTGEGLDYTLAETLWVQNDPTIAADFVGAARLWLLYDERQPPPDDFNHITDVARTWGYDQCGVIPQARSTLALYAPSCDMPCDRWQTHAVSSQSE